MRFILPAFVLIALVGCQQPPQKMSEPEVDPKLAEARRMEEAWKMIDPADTKTKCEEGPSVARAYRLAGDDVGTRQMEANVKIICGSRLM